MNVSVGAVARGLAKKPQPTLRQRRCLALAARQALATVDQA